MIIPRDIQQKYSEQESQIDLVSKRVASTLQQYCASRAFVFDGRPKSLESLAEKIETGRYASWGVLDDLFACTVAVPLPADEKEVLSFLSETFEQVTLKERLTARKAPDVFRFDSTRFVGRLRMPEGTVRDSIYDISFEVQVKTLFELAWAKTTHALAYKSWRVDWRALRLAANLKASVEQMDLLLSDFENAMKLIGSSPWYEIERKNVIQEAFLKIQPKIPTEAWPKDMSRFIENCYSLIELLQKNERHIKRLYELDIYSDAMEEFANYLGQLSKDSFPRSISLFQLVFAVLTKRYGFPPFRAGHKNSFFPISSEMEELFPHVKSITNRFQFT